MSSNCLLILGPVPSCGALENAINVNCELTHVRGPDLIGIYNEAFIPILGDSHPSYMGKGHFLFFPDQKDKVAALYEEMRTTKVAAHLSDYALFLNRNGYLEETYWSGVLNPLRDIDGNVAGFYNSVVEVTRQKLNDRRRTMVNMISMFTENPTIEKLWDHIIDCLATNRHDIPVALLYQVTTDSDTGEHHLTLRGSLGLPENHKFLVQSATLDDHEGLVPLLSEARSEIVTVEAKQEWGDIEWAGFGEPSKYVTAIPVSNTGKLLSFLITANNPRRPLDPDHEQFIVDISRQMSTTIASTMGLEESRLRQTQLQQQLAESERQIRYMAQHSDIGMQHLGLDGKLIWANGHYFTMIGLDPNHPDAYQRPFIFSEHVLDEDYAVAKDAWDQVLQGHKAHTTEVRLKRKYTPTNGDPVPATILLSSFPYMESGQVKSIMACMTDVSRLKFAESWQARIAQEAREAKRQQGEYIDVISHEVRNPLSAILQLADGITSSLDTHNAHQSASEEYKTIIEENMEAARTILTCAQHQKRIVDDVLSLSKMDFELMTLTPSSTSQKELVEGAVRMLEADLSSGNVRIHTQQDKSAKDLSIDAIMCDPLRATQVLINLLSNAIKFTKREARRDITMRYGATVSDPRKSFPSNIQWAAPKRTMEDITLNPTWGTGEALYLTFRIDDTGPGMTAEELRRLFNRFEQATPRTSIKYGGSGLGLFISHTLTEKQSGSIGVSSDVGQGSTFAFYIKVRRTTRPETMPIKASPIGNEVTTTKKESTSQLQNDFPPATEHESTSKHREPDTDKEDNKTTQPKPLPEATYNVLLVEDNLINQRVLKRQLIKAGCTVLVANHGVEALEILKTTSRWKNNNPNSSSHNLNNHNDEIPTSTDLDVILMDWEMPVMDGLTCSEEIRRLESTDQMTGHVEIIATTANVRQEQVDRIKAAGADTVMPKPFKVAELLDLIKERLNQGQPPRASLKDVEGYQPRAMTQGDIDD